MTRDELLRRTNHKTPEQKGWEYLGQLYLMTVIFFVVFFGIIFTIMFWNYPDVADVADVEAEILEHVEMYLEGEGYFSKPFSTPYQDVEIGTYKMQKDYRGTLRSGCSKRIIRRSWCKTNFSYKVFLSYQVDGKLMSGTFQLISRRNNWEVMPK